MNRELADLVDQCVGDIRSGRKTFAQCVEAHPRWANDLRAFLAIALAMEPPTVPIDPLRKQAARRQLLAALHEEPMRRSSWSAVLAGLLVPMRPGLAAPVVALLLVLATSATTVLAAQGAGPSDVLYPVKLAIEDAQAAVAPSPSAKAQLRIESARKRLAEAESAIDAGRSEAAESAIREYARTTAEASAAVESARNAGSEVSSLVEKLKDNTQQAAKVETKARSRGVGTPALAASDTTGPAGGPPVSVGPPQSPALTPAVVAVPGPPQGATAEPLVVLAPTATAVGQAPRAQAAASPTRTPIGAQQVLQTPAGRSASPTTVRGRPPETESVQAVPPAQPTAPIEVVPSGPGERAQVGLGRRDDDEERPGRGPGDNGPAAVPPTSTPVRPVNDPLFPPPRGTSIPAQDNSRGRGPQSGATDDDVRDLARVPSATATLTPTATSTATAGPGRGLGDDEGRGRQSDEEDGRPGRGNPAPRGLQDILPGMRRAGG